VRELGVVNLQNKFVPFESGKTRRCSARDCVQVQTDDMSPLIRSGQWILLAEPDRMPHDGDIVMLSIRGQTWVRRYRFMADEKAAVLEAINSDSHVRPVFVRTDDTQSVRVVLGVVFE
jgi:SOS-response transcriptional repressor LexA